MTQRPAPRIPSEVAAIERAVRAVAARLTDMLRAVRPGATADDVLALANVRPGSALAVGDAVADLAINAGLPLGDRSSRPFAPGDLVTIDLAAPFGGVWGDLADAVVVPGPGDEQALGFLQVARNLTRRLATTLVPGRLWSEVVSSWRAEVQAAGLEVVPGFAGHGIGADLHEHPAAPYAAVEGGPPGPQDDFTLRPGLVFTVEPVLRSGCARWVTWIERVVVIGSSGARCLGAGWDDLSPLGA